MATKFQVLQWAKAKNIDTTGMSQRQIEAALDAATQPGPSYTFSQIARNNARALVEALRGQ